MNPMLHPDAPKFWRFESSGVLAPAIERYLKNETLTIRDVTLIRRYFEQWINSTVWDQNPNHDAESRAELARLRKTAAAIATARDIRDWVHEALDIGVDPL